MRIASWSSPRPETRSRVGRVGLPPRGVPGLRLRSFISRCGDDGEVTYLPSSPREGETLRPKQLDTVGSSMTEWREWRIVEARPPYRHVDALDTGDGDDLTALGLGDISRASALRKPVQHGDIRLLDGTVAVKDGHAVGLRTRPFTMAPMMSRPRNRPSRASSRGTEATAGSKRGAGTVDRIVSRAAERQPIDLQSVGRCRARVWCRGRGKRVIPLASRSMKR